MEEIKIQSEQIDSLVPALIKLHKEKSKELDPGEFLQKKLFQPMGKDSYTHEWVILKPYLDHINPILAGYGLVISGVFWGHNHILQLMHESGQWIRSNSETSKPGDKAQFKGAQVTMMRRYQLMSLLNIDDGTSDTDGADDIDIIVADDQNHMSQKQGERSTEKAIASIPDQLFIPTKALRSKEKIDKLKEDIGDEVLKLMKYDIEIYKNGIDTFLEYASVAVIKASYDAAVLLSKKKKK